MCSKMRKWHSEVLQDWRIVTAIATPDVDNVEKLYHDIEKTEFMPCAGCLSFVISKSTDLGRLCKINIEN